MFDFLGFSWWSRIIFHIFNFDFNLKNKLYPYLPDCLRRGFFSNDIISTISFVPIRGMFFLYQHNFDGWIFKNYRRNWGRAVLLSLFIVPGDALFNSIRFLSTTYLVEILPEFQGNVFISFCTHARFSSSFAEPDISLEEDLQLLESSEDVKMIHSQRWKLAIVSYLFVNKFWLAIARLLSSKILRHFQFRVKRIITSSWH